jgi:hypothetical protein
VEWALPHCEKGKAKGRRKVDGKLRPYERSRGAEHSRSVRVVQSVPAAPEVVMVAQLEPPYF